MAKGVPKPKTVNHSLVNPITPCHPRKHGRIAMLAFVGLVVPEVVRIPGPRRGSLGFRVLSPKFKFFHLHWFLAWTRVEPPMLACCRCSSCHCCYCCVAACYMSRVV